MLQKYLISFFLIVAIVFAHRGGPPFLKGASREAVKEFFKIQNNKTAKISEIESQTSAWAEKYNVTATYKAAEAKRVEFETGARKNVTTVIANLPTVKTQLEAIFDNKDQTFAQQRQAVDALRTKYPKEVVTLFHLSGPPPPPPRGGRGGRRGGRRH
ncbi:unnamed protein product [Caenorhabditis angaria]|uniref:SXP/RAL-2 family protein Ani s 5-like cation-binding domain-containing protein n=1 Tax=Caenorhabditis angaria TaxID=860376 RepID=A0A9P1IPH9_9PELO|nr:unnamed protein product [Caenorhabditis angaria]